MKTDYLHLRIAPEEKEEIRQTAKEKGFDNITSFILWLFRRLKKGE